jgi:hypothetical protein
VIESRLITPHHFNPNNHVPPPNVPTYQEL